MSDKQALPLFVVGFITALFAVGAAVVDMTAFSVVMASISTISFAVIVLAGLFQWLNEDDS